MRLILLILLFATAACSQKQPKRAQFPTNIFGQEGTDRGVGIAITSEMDGYIIAGFTTSFGASGEDIYVVRTDREGQLVWQKTFGGNGDDNAWSIKNTNDGNYIIAGFSSSFSGGDMDIYVLRINGNGDELWSGNIQTPKDQFAWDIIVDSDDNYLVVGQTSNTVDGRESSICLKLNNQGDTLWTYQQRRENSNRSFGIVEIDSAYFISGLFEIDSTNLDGFVTKLDKQGFEVWTKTYGGPNDDIGHSINESHDGKIIFSGYSKSYGNGNSSPWILKLDLNGDEIWSNSFGTFLEERTVSSTVSKNGETILLGYVFKEHNVDLLLVGVNPFGQLQWMKTFGSPKNEEAGQTILLNGKSQIIYTGRTYEVDSSEGDLFIMIDRIEL